MNKIFQQASKHDYYLSLLAVPGAANAQIEGGCRVGGSRVDAKRPSTRPWKHFHFFIFFLYFMIYRQSKNLTPGSLT